MEAMSLPISLPVHPRAIAQFLLSPTNPCCLPSSLTPYLPLCTHLLSRHLPAFLAGATAHHLWKLHTSYESKIKLVIFHVLRILQSRPEYEALLRLPTQLLQRMEAEAEVLVERHLIMKKEGDIVMNGLRSGWYRRNLKKRGIQCEFTMKGKERDDYDKRGMEMEVYETERRVKRRGYVDAEVETQPGRYVDVGIDTDEFVEEQKKRGYGNGGTKSIVLQEKGSAVLRGSLRGMAKLPPDLERYPMDEKELRPALPPITHESAERGQSIDAEEPEQEIPRRKRRRGVSPSPVRKSVESVVYSRDWLINTDHVRRIPYRYSTSPCSSVFKGGKVQSFGRFSDLLTSSESASISPRIKLPGRYPED